MHSEDDIHIYFRDKRGRIVTHGYWPIKEFLQIEMAAQSLEISVEEFIQQAISDWVKKYEAI
jgi:hypothetical protein